MSRARHANVEYLLRRPLVVVGFALLAVSRQPRPRPVTFDVHGALGA
jgi:hypothetical protein